MDCERLLAALSGVHQPAPQLPELFCRLSLPRCCTASIGILFTTLVRWKHARPPPQIAADIGILAQATVDPGDGRLQSALHKFLENRHPRVTVTHVAIGANDSSKWSLSNGAPIDTTRTQLNEQFTLSDGSGGELQVTVEEGIRPALTTALVRAWTFSIADYLRAPSDWWEHALYNRSMPLYGYLLTVVLVGFGTIRALYRDQRELQRLDAEGRQITAELDAVRATHVEELDSLQGQITDIRAQREEAAMERDRLQAELAGIDTEYQQLVKGAPAGAGGSTVAVRLRDNAARRSEARLALASYNEQVARFESELASAQAEMQAAEQLVSEVDDKRENLSAKLRERNREIRKLQSLVQQAQKEALAIQLRAAQQPRSEENAVSYELSQDSVESQLAQWIRAPGEARVSFFGTLQGK